MTCSVASVDREMPISSCMDCLGLFQAGLVEESSIRSITEQPQWDTYWTGSMVHGEFTAWKSTTLVYGVYVVKQIILIL